MDQSELSPKPPESIDVATVVNYEKVIGNNGLSVFRDKVIPLAKTTFGAYDSKLLACLTALTEMGANTISPAELPNFWEDQVSSDTFEFQKEYAALAQPSDITPASLAFHINSADKIQENIVDGKLRSSQSYFASGPVDTLAKFLAGHALTHRIGWDKAAFRNANHPQFSQSQAIAVANTAETEMNHLPSGHQVITFYSQDTDTVDLDLSDKQTPVQVISLPLTILLPDQIEQLRKEGAALYREGKFYTSNLPFKLEGEEHAADIYAFSRHQELTIKYSLLKFIRSQVAKK